MAAFINAAEAGVGVEVGAGDIGYDYQATYQKLFQTADTTASAEVFPVFPVWLLTGWHLNSPLSKNRRAPRAASLAKASHSPFPSGPYHPVELEIEADIKLVTKYPFRQVGWG